MLISALFKNDTELPYSLSQLYCHNGKHIKLICLKIIINCHYIKSICEYNVLDIIPNITFFNIFCQKTSKRPHSTSHWRPYKESTDQWGTHTLNTVLWGTHTLNTVLGQSLFLDTVPTSEHCFYIWWVFLLIKNLNLRYLF